MSRAQGEEMTELSSLGKVEQGLGAQLPRFRSGLQRQSSLCLSFPMPKIGVITVPACEVVVRIK